MNRRAVPFEEIKELSSQVSKQILESGRTFDCIIGIAKGGCIPATLISYQLEVPTFKTIQIKSYTDSNKRSNTIFSSGTLSLFDELSKYENVLVIDDLADSGKTLSDFEKLYNYLSDTVKVPNIFTACLYYKSKSEFKPDWYAEEVKDEAWLDFPWEE